MTESLLTQLPSTSVQKLDENKNYVEELVGDGKKFKSVEDLARGKYEADLHIELKNRQFDELAADYKRLREEYNAGPALKELIDQLASQKPTNTNDTQGDVGTQQPTFDPAQLDSLVTTKVKELEITRKSEDNFRTVKEKLQDRYGDSFPTVIASQTQKLGLTAEKVDDLARTAPQAFFKLMGLEDKATSETFQAPPRSSQRNDSFAPTVQTRKWSYYKNLVKTQPNLFSDAKAHNQMMADVKAIGEKDFYDVD